MAATAYAAAVSLLNTMDNIKIHPLLSFHFNINYSIESLRENVDFFVDFVEKYSDAESEEAEDLLRRIADVAHEAEEIINVEAANRVRDGSTTANQCRSSIITTGKLKKITEEMDCIKENAMNAKEGSGFRNPYSPPPPTSSSAPPPPPYSPLPLASSSAPPPTATTMRNRSYAEDLMRRVGAVALKAMPRKLRRKINVKAEEKTGFLNRHHTSSVPSSSSSAAAPATAKTTTMVGFDGYLEQLLDQLTGHHSGRQILPIVGMGGIGKTTLATNVYHNSLMLHHFDIRAWITVSQKFTERNIILQALSCLGEGLTSNTNTSKSDSQLGEELSKILYGRRYLIVLDDMWSIEAWEKIKFFFPDNNNGSRIVVTTRQQELVDYFGSSAITVNFLDEKNSWELFCEKTFGEEGCPPELEEIGKEIVKKCKGLPLAITVFGGLLRKSPPTRKYWERIAKDRSLILDSGEGSIKPLTILYLSYKHLPVWLKPCFLYLGLYPEDHEIDVPELIKLWVAEGFIRSKTEQSLEEVAESYTKELLDRNLILVRELRLDKKLISFRVHDIVRELCIRTGEREKYFCVQRDIDGKCHYIVDESTARLFYPRKSPKEEMPSIVHPLILERKRAKLPLESRLLKVSLVRDRTNLGSYSQDVNLRYFYSGFEDDNAIHSSMQLFWSLQTLIIRHSGKIFEAPREIWKMPQLRHIDMISISIPDPPSPTCEDDVIVLQNLQTLANVKNLVLSEEVCKRIPNIKELSITYKFNDAEEASRCNSHLQNLGRFNKLESLQLYCNYPGGDALLKLPSSITRLLLFECKLPWSDMAMIAALPHLQSLELWYQAFVGSEWNMGSEEFLCLKRLRIILCSDLIHWNIASGDSSNFPVLERLELALSKLEDIPSVIGEIPTLTRIDLKGCGASANLSAIEILKEQERQGNLGLQLTLYLDNEEEAEMWKGITQIVGISCQNLHFHTTTKN